MPTPAIYGHPGVYISESLIGPLPQSVTSSPSVGAFVGEHWKGPAKATLCQSWSDFVRYYGGFNTTLVPVLANPYLAYSVYMFFANGGTACWVQRVTGVSVAGATASCTLLDSSATPQPTLSLSAGLFGTAGNIGTWGNTLFVDVLPSGAGPGRFNINVYLGAYNAASRVEQWIDLSMSPVDARYAPNLINSPTAGSLYVVATDLGDVAAPPANGPIAVSGKQFTGGIDCASPAAADRTAAITAGNPTCVLDTVPGMINFAMPGEVAPSVASAAILYAGTRPFTFFVGDTPSGLTPAGAVSYFASLSPVTTNAAFYYPWQLATNPASSNLGSSILLPPSGFVLGQIAASDAAKGTWVAPAGITTVLSNVMRAERRLAPSDLDTLTAANVNGIKTRGDGSVVIWGVRTMAANYASLYVPVRRTLNYIESSLNTLLEFAVFQPNDQLLWTNISATCTSFLNTLLSAGAFGGATAQNAFYVTCNSSNNTQATINQGIVNTVVGVALLIPAEFVALNIAQFQSTGQTVITTTS